MNNKFFDTNTINSDADSTIRGMFFQKLRACNRLLDALDGDNRAIMCAIEFFDDVLQVDTSDVNSLLVTEQDKLKITPISLNSKEVINSIRIFFDNWRSQTMNSQNIKFAFYTNTTIAKENKTSLLKENNINLPNEPIIELLIKNQYDEVLEIFKLIFIDYYLHKHEQNLAKDKKDEYKKFKYIIESITDDEWKKFLSLIEWHFDKEDEITLKNMVKEKIRKLCIKYDIEEKFTDNIFSEIMMMIEIGSFEKDFLNKVVHVSELKILFLEKQRTININQLANSRIDPVYQKWDDISCDDIRNIEEKIKNVCNEYGEDIEDIQDDCVEGSFEEKQHDNKKAVKAFKYRIYKLCKKILKKNINKLNFSKIEIDEFIEIMTNECEIHIEDKCKTYDTIPFRDRDMIRKMVLILIDECYLSFDKGGV